MNRILVRNLLVGALALLTLTSLGVAAGSSSTRVDGRSAAASGASAASGRCSKAGGTAVVKRLGLSDPSVAYPVYKVLCGAFTGPGSQIMVASIYGPDNAGMTDWAVFRMGPGEWQLLMKRHQPALLTAAGTDIREAVPIYRHGDRFCCPSGGTKTRIWHWNGTRFTASAWTLTLAKLHLDNFLSPDRKVWCRIFPAEMEDEALCMTVDPQRSASLKRNGVVTICNGYCTQNWDRGAPVLRYGQQTEHYGYRCTSEAKGITCTVIAQGKGHGKGFLINRDGVSRVGL